MIKKPDAIKQNEFKSRKWDEITAGRKFRKSDTPILEMLVQWYAVAHKCQTDMDVGGDIQVAYQNDLGDIKSLPQIATLKTASAEIRQINKQLGIDDEVLSETPIKETTLSVITNRRKQKADRAANA